jgi:hypothetical protein
MLFCKRFEGVFNVPESGLYCLYCHAEYSRMIITVIMREYLKTFVFSYI